jgi:hypothetical protein
LSKITLTGNALGSGTFTIASPDSNSDRTLNLPDNSGTILTTATTTGIDASALSTGTVATARLASGTANSTTFLRGDSTWQTISTTPTTDQVLTATAGASVGAVGTYALAGPTAAIAQIPGATRAGSGLRYSTGDTPGGVLINAGTWRLMGGYPSGTSGTSSSVWLRIS